MDKPIWNKKLDDWDLCTACRNSAFDSLITFYRHANIREDGGFTLDSSQGTDHGVYRGPGARPACLDWSDAEIIDYYYTAFEAIYNNLTPDQQAVWDAAEVT
jgi:hypothetical protein